ncbi:MAG: hypothetical protein ACYCPT_13585 [Acidimicrobiales bacterium]
MIINDVAPVGVVVRGVVVEVVVATLNAESTLNDHPVWVAEYSLLPDYFTRTVQ